MDLSEGDIAILVDLFRRGDNSPKNIADSIGVTPVHVSNRLKLLSDRGLVVKKDPGVWTLTPDGLQLAKQLRGSYDKTIRGED